MSIIVIIIGFIFITMLLVMYARSDGYFDENE